MKFELKVSAKTDKGIIDARCHMSITNLILEAATVMADNEIDDESFNTILSGIICREIRPSVENLLKTYDKGPKEKSKIILLPGMKR